MKDQISRFLLQECYGLPLWVWAIIIGSLSFLFFLSWLFFRKPKSQASPQPIPQKDGVKTAGDGKPTPARVLPASRTTVPFIEQSEKFRRVIIGWEQRGPSIIVFPLTTPLRGDIAGRRELALARAKQFIAGLILDSETGLYMKSDGTLFSQVGYLPVSSTLTIKLSPTKEILARLLSIYASWKDDDEVFRVMNELGLDYPTEETYEIPITRRWDKRKTFTKDFLKFDVSTFSHNRFHLVSARTEFEKSQEPIIDAVVSQT